MRKSIIFILWTCLLNGCGYEDKQKMKAIHVFTHDCIPDPGTICPRHDFYYVYTYSPSDSATLLKMTDTLSIDTINGHHSYYFYKYSKIMPDTHILAEKMKDWEHYILREDIGTSQHYPNLIMYFSFQKKYYSRGRFFPDCFILNKKEENGQRRERYFIKDKFTKKFIEVSEDKIQPVNQ